LFDNTIADGSWLAVVLMIYVYGVMYNIGQVYVKDSTGVMTPGIVRSSLGTIAIIAMVPTIIWPTIYVSLFDGVFWAGVLTFLLTTVGGGIAGKLLGVTAARGAFMGIHFILATIAMVAGYWLSITNLPGAN